jgi:EmrB/QacA subfamily drug resistance transporter
MGETLLTNSSGLTHREVLWVIFGILLAMLLSALDQTIVVTAMPTIGHELGDAASLPWVITAYLLSSTAVTPLYGKVSDIIGRRVTLLFAIAVFMIGSLACALAPSMLLLILARGLQGLGGGGLISLAQTIVADIVSPKERPRYQVYIALVFVTSSIVGPLLGGVMAEHFHWSLIFWINLPLGLVAFLMVNQLLKKLPRHERPHTLDFLGAGLMVLATVALMLALNWGGNHYAWGSSQILGLLGISTLLWMAFVTRLRTAPEPFIPTEILRHPVVASGTAAASLGMGVFIGLTAYLPIYMEMAYGLTASGSGLALIPFMAGTVTGATLASQSMGKFKHYKRISTVGIFVGALGLLALAIPPHGAHFVVMECILPCISIGLGTLLPVTTVAVQNAVMPHQMGTATGSMNFFRSLGGALIVAGFGAILFAQMSTAEPATAFRLLFAVASLALFGSFGFFLIMPENPLRTGPARHVDIE